MSTAAEHHQAWSAAAGRVLEHVRAVLGFETAMVSRRSGERYVVLDVLDDRYGIRSGDELPWADTFCARVVDGRAPALVPDVAQVPAHREAAHLLGMDVGAYVSLPLRARDGELLGTLCAASPRVQDAGLLALRPVLDVLAQVLGALLASELALQRELRQRERAELAALVDPLTGLADRRAWELRLAGEETRCEVFGGGAAVVVVDLDGVVDLRTGVGDALLVAASTAIVEVAGEQDVAARTGGEEFGLLLPEADAERLASVVTALRAGLHARGVTAGVGAALRTPAGLELAWQQADALLVVEQARPPRSAVEVRPTGEPPPVAPDADDVLLRELLDLARRQTGAAISFVGEWRGGPSGVRVMRGVSSDLPLGIGRGHTEALDTTYCQRIVDGRLPAVIPDSSQEPEAVALEVTAGLPIGSYVGVPVVLSDGTLYGTLCCLSPTVDTRLSQRHADLLADIATSMARVLEVEQAAASAHGALVRRLDPVLRGDGLHVVFQPVVSIRDDRLVGVEALARFGADGAGAPAPWFLDAEAAGLGAALELAAARAALVAARDLPGFLSLNFSATTLCSAGFTELLRGADPSRLVVEVSEHEEVADYAPVLAALAPLRARGLRVAVDDAGAGFASLRHVVLLRPDVIKLDISLVRGIDSDPVRQALAAALTTFARATGAQVVAEGVESEHERAVLARSGVGLVQGWLAGPGVPAEEVQRRYGRRTVVPPPRPGTAPALHTG